MRRIVFTAALLTCLAWVPAASSQTDRGPISGKIVRGTRQPVVDAIVKFTLERSPAGFRRTTKSRPPDGKFSDEMPQGWVLVTAFKKDEDGSIWVGKDRVKVDTNFGASVPEIRLAQQKGEGGTSSLPEPPGTPATVEGILSAGRSPVGGFISVNDIRTGDEVAATTVGRDGRYRFTLSPNYEYLFTAMAGEHPAKLVVVMPASSARVDISLDR